MLGLSSCTNPKQNEFKVASCHDRIAFHEEEEDGESRIAGQNSPPTISSISKSREGNTRASLRSWGRSATMEKDPGIIPFLQHALLLRYREILNTYIQHAPPWCPTHYLEDVYPSVYQVLPSIYGTSKNLSSSEIQHDSYKPILPHQIFAKMSEDDMARVFWLEGEASSGKTLFCSKILSEWVAHNSYDYSNSGACNNRIGEFQVVFYVPLREVQTSSLSRFLLQDLIPKRSILKRMKPAHVCKCLNLLGRSMLLILDGLDDATEEVLKEVQDILNGQMFPQSLVLLTSRPMMPLDNSLMMNGHVRKYVVNGMHNTQIMCLIRRYFTGRKFRNEESQMADILSDRADIFALSSNPLMCLLLCSVYEEVGDLPTNAELYLCLIRSLIYQNGLIKMDTNSSSCKDSKTIPVKYEDALKSFGKLALHKLGENTVQFSEAEVTQYCQNFDILKCGVLTKWKGFFRKTTKKSSAYTLKLLHPSFNTFLAAYYLASTVNNPSLFRREMELLPGFELLQECQVCSDNVAFSVLQLVMEILQENSYVAFSTMSLIEISLNYLLALLRAAGFYESNVRSICSLIRSMKHLCIQNQRWLSELKQVIASGHCPFQSVEIVIKPGFSLCRLMEGLLLNKSISQVKFTSIPGQDWSETEVNLICGQLIQLLIDKKLKCLEICMTCLDMEDKEHSRFQAIVDSLCYVLSKQIPLQKLVLDMDLTSSQVIQLTSFIKCHTYIQILQLPHLGCGPEGLRAVSEILPLLSSLNLAGTWRSNDDIDLEPTPFVYSSLPRGPNMMNGTLKSPSIRRKKLNQLTAEDDKRNSDSALFQRNFLPLPICDQSNHEFDGFHAIFSGLRNFSDCKLHSLDVSKCVLGWEDVICLGETIRKATCLESLRMEGMKLCDVLPVLLGIQENASLKMVHLSSPHVVMADDALQLACQSLSQNRTLRLLSVQGWTFYVEEEKSLECLETLFGSTNLQDVDLTNVRVHLSSTSKTKGGGGGNNSDKASMTSTLDKKYRKEVVKLPKESKTSAGMTSCTRGAGKKSSISSVMSFGGGGFSGVRKVFPNLSFLRIGGMQVELGKSQVWRSMDIAAHLLPIVDKGRITHIDLSLDKSDGNFTVEDKVVMKTMKLVGQNLPKLQRLVLQHWRIKFMSEKSAKEMGRYLQGLDCLSGINMDHCSVHSDTAGNSSAPSKRIDHLVTSSILSSVKNLTDFSWANFDALQMPQLARALCNNHGAVPTLGLTVKLESVPLTAIKILINNSHARSNSSNVVVEYIGNHSVIVRKSKDKGDHLMHKLKKLL